jgi:hypothetical protein
LASHPASHPVSRHYGAVTRIAQPAREAARGGPEAGGLEQACWPQRACPLSPASGLSDLSTHSYQLRFPVGHPSSPLNEPGGRAGGNRARKNGSPALLEQGLCLMRRAGGRARRSARTALPHESLGLLVIPLAVHPLELGLKIASWAAMASKCASLQTFLRSYSKAASCASTCQRCSKPAILA